MAKAKGKKAQEPKEETREERDERLREVRQAEAAATARNVSPQAGEELDEGSDARKAKLKDAGK